MVPPHQIAVSDYSNNGSSADAKILVAGSWPGGTFSNSYDLDIVGCKITHRGSTGISCSTIQPREMSSLAVGIAVPIDNHDRCTVAQLHGMVMNGLADVELVDLDAINFVSLHHHVGTSSRPSADVP
jgi:hypothetical protein